MKLASLLCSGLTLVAATVAAQDPIKVAGSHYKLVAENDRVRVLHVSLPAGASVPMHAHPAHVGVILSAGSLAITNADGKTTNIEAKGDEAVLMPAGAHSTSNVGKTGSEVIVIEMKGAPGTAQIPASRPGMKMTRILEDARVEAYRVTVDSSFSEPAGTTHPYDQVVIPLGAGDVALTMDCKTKSTWKRGDAQLIGRGVAHESKGGKMTGDMIIVSIK